MNKQVYKMMIIGFITTIVMTYASYYTLNKTIVEKTDLIINESEMTQNLLKCIPADYALTKVSDGVYKSRLHETAECFATIMNVAYCCMPGEKNYEN
jgi:hypothetical protein